MTLARKFNYYFIMINKGIYIRIVPRLFPRNSNITPRFRSSIWESHAVFGTCAHDGNEFARQAINSRASTGLSFVRANEQRCTGNVEREEGRRFEKEASRGKMRTVPKLKLDETEAPVDGRTRRILCRVYRCLRNRDRASLSLARYRTEFTPISLDISPGQSQNWNLRARKKISRHLVRF